MGDLSFLASSFDVVMGLAELIGLLALGFGIGFAAIVALAVLALMAAWGVDLVVAFWHRHDWDDAP